MCAPPANIVRKTGGVVRKGLLGLGGLLGTYPSQTRAITSQENIRNQLEAQSQQALQSSQDELIGIKEQEIKEQKAIKDRTKEQEIKQQERRRKQKKNQKLLRVSLWDY